jgi:hypothetical protein
MVFGHWAMAGTSGPSQTIAQGPATRDHCHSTNVSPYENSKMLSQYHQ